MGCRSHVIGVFAHIRGGFTLLEMILTLGILVMLLAVTTVTIGRGHDRKVFDEGVSRFEATLRMARVEAAREGKRFRVLFESDGEDTEVLRVQWEPQPLTEPGVFSNYENLSTWAGYMPSHEIRPVSCRLIGASAYRVIGDAEGSDAAELEAITFFPDGSSDSALIVLEPSGFDDVIRAVVRLDGVNGIVKTWTITDNQLEENLQDIELGLYSPVAEGEQYE